MFIFVELRGVLHRKSISSMEVKSKKFSKLFQFIKSYRVYWLSLLMCFLILAVTPFLRAGEEPFVNYTIKTESIKLLSHEQILQVKDHFVKPNLYTNLSGLDKLPVRKAKAKFVAAVLPSILVAKYEIEQRKRKIEWMRNRQAWIPGDSAFYDDMKNRYRAKDIDDLLVRMGTLPTSVVLAQAAVESGWGKSRFFLTANNLFGVWSYNASEPRVPALKTRNSKRIYLRSYTDMSESIVHYFEILARSRSYKSLREARQKTNNPFELLPHLKNFSERRSLYTNQLKKVIIRNNFTQFDSYAIDPTYVQEADE